jgi:CRISPR-associated protein Cmr5
MIRSLEQRRAEFAFKKIEEVAKRNRKVQDKYSSYVKKAPVLIQTNGLGSALLFFKSKFGEGEESDLSADKEAYRLLYDHINEWLKERGFTEGKDAVEWIISADSLKVFQATEETIALLNWLKRFAEAKLEGGDENE